MSVYTERSTPQATLRPVRAADPAGLGRSQVEAALGVRRSGRKRVVAPATPDLPPPLEATTPPKPRGSNRVRAKLLNARGLAAYRRGLNEDALALYSQALAADPSYHWAHYNAACMLAMAGDVEAAIEHLKSWERHAPDSVDPAERIIKDSDFDRIREDPRLQAWLSSPPPPASAP
jgi:tetratricopeptide (TPR) repeat protein